MTRFGFMVPLVVSAAACIVLASGAVFAQEPQEKFSPPTASERRSALGSLEDLTPDLARAFDPAEHFTPMGEPGERDWLSVVPEPGQSHTAFLENLRRWVPREGRNTIYIQPLGDFPTGKSPSMDTLSEFLTAFYGLEVKLREPQAVSDQLTTRINEHTKKRQVLTGDIFELLVVDTPKDAFAIVALTMEDLYPREDRNFTFGQGGGMLGVYSFARFDPTFYGLAREEGYEKMLLQRSLKVMIHEVGHIFGLAHCTYYACLMNGANNLEETDSHPVHLCPVCLRKIHASLGFDVKQRYARLRELYARHGIEDEAEWLGQRLEFLAAQPTPLSTDLALPNDSR